MSIFNFTKKQAQTPKLQSGLPETCLTDKTTLNLKALETALNTKARELGLTMGKVTVNAISQTPCVSAGIAQHGWGIEMSVNPDFSSVMDGKTEQYLKANGSQTAPLQECNDMLVHEVGHWKHCPKDNDTHVNVFMEQAGKAIRECNRDPTESMGGKDSAGYLVNVIEDILNNTACKEQTSMAGQIVFWKEQGESTPNKKYTPLYEAFVKLNLHLWGEKEDRKFLNGYFANDAKANKAYEKIAKELSLEENLKSKDFIADESNWGRISYVMAKHLAPLMDNNNTDYEKMFGSGEAMGNPKNGKMEPMGPGDAGKLVMGRYKKGEGAPSFMDEYYALRSLYQQLAKEIPVNAASLAKGSDLPYANMRHRTFDPEVDDPGSIDLRKIGIGDDGKPTLMVAHSHLSLPYKIKHGIESFPPISVCILDTSISMADDMQGGSSVGNTSFVPWGDKSKYHFALLGFFGIMNYLANNGLLSRVKMNSVNFSTTSSVGLGIEDAVKNLLTPKFGWTNIDMAAISAASKTGGVLFTISDGEVQNWGSVKDEFVRNAKTQHFFHIQIGGSSGMSKDLQNMGFPVYNVKNGNELASLMIDLTAKSYTSVVANVRQ